MKNQGIDVLVVGAGPVGLTAACVLQEAGHRVLVVDASDEGVNTSRAAVIHARTLEVLEEISITPRLLEEGIVVPVFTIRDRTKVLARLDFSGLKTAYPYTLMLPQSPTEQLLTERLHQLGGSVQRPHRVTSLSQTSWGVSAVVESGAGMDARTVDARFVIGADGAHSVVRDASGIAFEGVSYEQAFVLADVVMDWPLATKEVQLFFSPAGLVVVAPLPGGRHRIVATVDNAPAHPTVHDVHALLSSRGPGTTRITEVVWSSRFRVQHRIASTYRHGSVFLAGDAAHVHSPAGGQGMNTGIQDAVDLGSTLSRVLSGEVGPEDLDGYEQRRRPIAEKVLSLTDRMTRMATVRGPAQRAARNIAISTAMTVPAVRRALALRIAELR